MNRFVIVLVGVASVLAISPASAPGKSAEGGQATPKNLAGDIPLEIMNSTKTNICEFGLAPETKRKKGERPSREKADNWLTGKFKPGDTLKLKVKEGKYSVALLKPCDKDESLSFGGAPISIKGPHQIVIDSGAVGKPLPPKRPAPKGYTQSYTYTELKKSGAAIDREAKSANIAKAAANPVCQRWRKAYDSAEDNGRRCIEDDQCGTGHCRNDRCHPCVPSGCSFDKTFSSYHECCSGSYAGTLCK